MQVSLHWLKEYLDLQQSPEKIGDAMTLAGLEVEGIEQREGDFIFEIGLTPNLGHCMSVVGIGRELSAILQIPLRRKEVLVVEQAPPIKMSVHIEDKEQCLSYSCRLVRNVKVSPSPDWLVKKLSSVGLRSVNNVVDVGNLVMLECGQPLHMFDADQLEGKKIVVRPAAKEGKMQTLDGTEREIPDGVLLVCDEKKAVAFAGVMGELSSAVSEKTQNVLIEAAEFAPHAIRKSSKLLNLKTDSSQRFERGIDPLGIRGALDMATALLQEVAEGAICSGVAEEIARIYEPHIVEMDPKRANQLLGVDLSIREMCLLLGRLEIQVLIDSPEQIKVAVPSYRNDLRKEIDLIEEVGRMYGFNNIPRLTPRHTSSTITHAPLYLFEEEMRNTLVGLGLQECLTCDLISPKLAALTVEKALDQETQIHVLYPASIDQSVLRPSLLPGLLGVVKFNLDRQNENLAAFEVGHIHFKTEEKFLGESAAGIILTGKEAPYHFEEKPQEINFFILKGYVENLLEAVGAEEFHFEPSHLQNFHPGRQARIKIGECTLGALGEIHPQHLRELEIGQRVYYAEIHFHDLMKLRKEEPKAQSLPLFPGSERDWTVTLPEKTSLGSVLKEMRNFASPILENVFLLDLYKSDKIGKDRKNVTFRFQYRDLNKTIAYEEVEKEHARMIERISALYNV